jgi:hypothetical protein
MFADPQTVTVNAVAKSLVRIKEGNGSSEYWLREATQEFRLKIKHTSYTPKGGILTDRHSVELTNVVYAVGGSTPSPERVRKIYTVIEHSRSDTVTDPLNVALALAGWESSANIAKLINNEP